MAPTLPPSLPPLIASTLDDSPYRVSPWNAADALFSITGESERQEVVQAAEQMQAALQPCSRDWLKKRLSAMALAFGHERDPERVTAWLAETGRLLWDLPGDILAFSIDEAIKRSERGFMPAVGQIRAIADPRMAHRRQQASRLTSMSAVINRQLSKDRPFEAGEGKQPAAEEDRIPLDQIDAFNRNMRKFGLAMRCGSDGLTFNLKQGAADSTDPAASGSRDR